MAVLPSGGEYGAFPRVSMFLELAQEHARVKASFCADPKCRIRSVTRLFDRFEIIVRPLRAAHLVDLGITGGDYRYSGVAMARLLGPSTRYTLCKEQIGKRQRSPLLGSDRYTPALRFSVGCRC
jgi:hypothetical protein